MNLKYATPGLGTGTSNDLALRTPLQRTVFLAEQALRVGLLATPPFGADLTHSAWR